MTSVFSSRGEKVSDVTLPSVFHSAYQPLLIRRAVLAVESTKFQPKGKKPGSGRNNTAEYIGVRGKHTPYRTINVGHARLPRLRNRRAILYGKVAAVPQAVGGPESHPPKVEARLEEYINTKERKKAIASAIAATVDAKLVKARGHRFDEKMYPLIVDKTFTQLSKTKDVVKALEALHVNTDVENAKQTRTRRAGKNKNRGRPYKQKKSVLIVTQATQPIYSAARNLPGVDVVALNELNAAHLAPGTAAGRLTIWSQEAITALAKREESQ